jgi:hypothetical protein
VRHTDTNATRLELVFIRLLTVPHTIVLSHTIDEILTGAALVNKLVNYLKTSVYFLVMLKFQVVFVLCAEVIVAEQFQCAVCWLYECLILSVIQEPLGSGS